MISDEVIDAIAQIELQRQEMEKEAGLAAACNEALRKLHELLERERKRCSSTARAPDMWRTSNSSLPKSSA